MVKMFWDVNLFFLFSNGCIYCYSYKCVLGFDEPLVSVSSMLIGHCLKKKQKPSHLSFEKSFLKLSVCFGK